MYGLVRFCVYVIFLFSLDLSDITVDLRRLHTCGKMARFLRG